MSLQFESKAGSGQITAMVDPPTRRAPKQILLRFRHPEQKPIRRVEVNGKPSTGSIRPTSGSSSRVSRAGPRSRRSTQALPSDPGQTSGLPAPVVRVPRSGLADRGVYSYRSDSMGSRLAALMAG